MPNSVRYHFSQTFSISAQEAFDWCTSFDPNDHTLMGEQNALREVIRVADGTIILKDSFFMPKGKVKKQKLVALYPERFSWTSTHLSGPNKHSQFLYQIASQGKDSSVLNFTALHLEYAEIVEGLAEGLCREDAAVWKILATTMEKDIRTKK